nr:nephrin-like [Procambarus clarkii]XP_045589353.1 nephrin-like [Procambarus clarkii]XP_045589360.1 nephrin-like [Procambarus clarkii]
MHQRTGGGGGSLSWESQTRVSSESPARTAHTCEVREHTPHTLNTHSGCWLELPGGRESNTTSPPLSCQGCLQLPSTRSSSCSRPTPLFPVTRCPGRPYSSTTRSKPPIVCGSNQLLLLVLLFCATLNISHAKAPPEDVETLATWTARLPCRVKNVDTPLLVLWYRNKETLPFYSYDARGGNLSAGSGRVHGSNLGPRSKFVLLEKESYLRVGSGQDPASFIPVFPGYLELSHITRADNGSFSCRVDFLNSPTQTHRLHLTVYERPSSVTVVDGRGHTLTPGPGGLYTAGPFNHTSPLLLTCNVLGGWPAPTVEWLRGGRRLVSSTDNGGDGSVGSRLFINSLKAEDYMAEVQCVVTNNNLTAPLHTRVRIDMNVEPTSVVITGVEGGLEAGARQEVKCVSTGSRPPANLTWDLEGEPDWSPLQVTETVTRTGSSESRVVWNAQPEDNEKGLSCTATNPRNPHYYLTNYTRLVVYHPPLVSLSIGRGLDPASIREGVDVYFTCSVQANPPANKIIFFHEGTEVTQVHQAEFRVLVTANSLVLQKVQRVGSGRYSCRATNNRGSKTSNFVRLDVLYEPRCMTENQVVTVTPGENATVDCGVDAFPPPHRFSWSLNSTKGLQVVPKEEYESTGSSSRLTYITPLTLKKMIILCWAVNELGTLRQPCTTTLIAAGVPERVESCEVVEQRVSSLKVSCVPGFDGGLEQHFIALVMEPLTNRVVANVTALTPEFSIGGLAAGLDYSVKVFSYNSKGSSPPYLLDGFSLKVAENRMDSGGGPGKGASPLLALFIGVLAAFVLTLTVIIVATKLRCRARATARDGDDGAGGRSDDSEDDEGRGVASRQGGVGGARRSSVEVKLMSVVRPDEEDMADESLKQQQQQQQQQHQLGLITLQDTGSPRDYTCLESKPTSESLYSSCTSNRCGMGYSTESAMLLSSSPSSCSATAGVLGGLPCSSAAVGPASGPGVGAAGPAGMMGMMYGSLGRSLGQTWGQYSTLTRPPPPAHDPGVETRFHTLSTTCTRRPSESFV